MNFIAGFLFLFLQDEALSFAVLREIINQFNLSTLFNTELPMLKLNFYRLDRLISILLPDLHSHFKEESVNSSYFSSSYFITLFTQMMQYQTTSENMWKLLRVWDYFVIVSYILVLTLFCLVRLEGYFQDFAHDSVRVRRKLARYDFRDIAFPNIAPAPPVPCDGQPSEVWEWGTEARVDPKRNPIIR